MAQLRSLHFTSPNRTHLFFGLARACLAGVVFFTPLVALPGLTDQQELPKAVIFIGLTLMAVVAWTLAWMTSGELRWRRVPGQWLLLGFSLLAVLATIFSTQRSVSMLGFSGYVHDTLPFLLAGVLFVVLAVQVFDRERDMHALLVILATALGLTALQAVLQLAGVSPFPFPSLQSRQFLVAGNSVVAFSVLMAVFVMLATVLFRSAQALVWKILCGVGVGLGLLMLLAIDVTAGWVVLVVGSVITLIVLSVRPLQRLHVVVSTVMLAIALIGLLLPTASLVGSKVVHDAQLDGNSTWVVASSTIRSLPLLGSGPATFYYDFLAHHPASLNNTALAGFSFVKGADSALTMLSSLGLLGIGALLGIALWTIMVFTRNLEKLMKRLGDDWEFGAAVFGIFMAVVVGMFFSPGMTSFAAVFWFTTAFVLLLLVSDQTPAVTKLPITRLLGTTTFIVSVLLLVFVGVWSTRMIMADRELVNVSSAVRRTEDLNLVMARIDRAIRLVPQNPLPYFLRAQAGLIQAQLVPSAEAATKVPVLVSQAVQNAQAGIARDPKNAVLYTTLGAVYKAVGSLTNSGAGDQVLAAYTQAAKFDPNNAKVHVDLGQASYLIAAALTGQKDAPPSDITTRVDQARSEFNQAVTLNAGNLDAQFGLVLVDELTNQKDRAFTRLTQLTNVNQSSAALWYELAIRQIDRKDDASAKTSLNNALTLQPSFAGAYVQLGIIAEHAKDIATARKDYEQAKSLDSSNTEAQTRLDALPKP